MEILINFLINACVYTLSHLPKKKIFVSYNVGVSISYHIEEMQCAQSLVLLFLLVKMTHVERNTKSVNFSVK